MKRLIQYIKRLTESESKESSKRFIALFTMILVSYAVIRFTTSKNMELVVGELLTFVLLLCGVAVYQSVKKNQQNGENLDGN